MLLFQREDLGLLFLFADMLLLLYDHILYTLHHLLNIFLANIYYHIHSMFPYRCLVKLDILFQIFETASTVSNTGLSAGITTMNLDSISKLILSINMIMGRVEIIAILYIFFSKLRR